MAASIAYDVVKQRWLVKDQYGVEKGEFSAVLKWKGGCVFTTGSLAVGAIESLVVGGGTSFVSMQHFVGTLPLTNVGTTLTAVCTLVHGATVTTGCRVFISPKAALAQGVILAGGYVPSTSCVNIVVGNIAPVTGGSQPAIGVDVLAIG